MSETYFAAKAAVLRAASGAGVRQLAKKLQMGPATVIRLRSEMVDQGLVEVGEASAFGLGRPKERMTVTALGREYLKAYEALKSTVLKSRRSDLARASSDGRYAKRLADRGVSTIDLFLGLISTAERTRKAAR